MKLEVNGTPYDKFLTLTSGGSMAEFGRYFSFTAAKDELTFPMTMGQTARVTVDGVPILTGVLETFSPSASPDNKEIVIEGRSRTIYVLESTLENIVLNPPISLKKIIEAALTAVGDTEIKVIDNSGGIDDFQKDELIAATVGETYFNFIEQFARKRQVILLDTGDGNIEIARADGVRRDFDFINRLNDFQGNNTVKNSDTLYDYTERFREYKVVSKQSLTGISLAGSNTSIKDAANSIGQKVIDDEVDDTRRIMIIKAEKSSSPQQATNRAIWEANIRKARSRKYNALVQGHVMRDGQPFNYNSLHKVADDDSDIDDLMLVEEFEMTETEDAGTETVLFLLNKNAYTLIVSEPPKDRRNSKLGGIFLGDN